MSESMVHENEVTVSRFWGGNGFCAFVGTGFGSDLESVELTKEQVKSVIKGLRKWEREQRKWEESKK